MRVATVVRRGRYALRITQVKRTVTLVWACEPNLFIEGALSTYWWVAYDWFIINLQLSQKQTWRAVNMLHVRRRPCG